MRGRLLLLLLLCMVLIGLRALPEGTVPAAAAADTVIWIDMSSMSLTLYQNGKQAGRWPIAVGTGETPTPLGTYVINRRFTPQGGGFGTRFLGINVPWGQYGIHGTNKPGSIGSHASHGCIRMYNKDVEALYRMTPTWTRVIIEDGPYGGLGWSLPTLRPQDRGSAVKVAQGRLRQLGYYWGAEDGIYGAGTTSAVQRFKKDMGMPQTDVIDAATWEKMGVILFE